MKHRVQRLEARSRAIPCWSCGHRPTPPTTMPPGARDRLTANEWREVHRLFDLARQRSGGPCPGCGRPRVPRTDSLDATEKAAFLDLLRRVFRPQWTPSQPLPVSG